MAMGGGGEGGFHASLGRVVAGGFNSGDIFDFVLCAFAVYSFG